MKHHLRANRAEVSVDGGVASLSNKSPAVSRRRIVAFRIIAGLLGLFFLYAGLSNAAAPWMAVPAMSGDLHPELHRWFSTVAGASDLIAAGCFVALALRSTQTLLFLYLVIGIVMAAGINLPFVPGFAIILALTMPALATYPSWSALRDVTHWWHRPHALMLTVSALAAVVVSVTAVRAIGRQVDAADAAAQANWWADYAEHVSLPAVAALLASSRQLGWRILASLAAAVWIYLGAVATFVLTDDAGSWGTIGGLAGIGFGLILAIVCLLARRDPIGPPEPGPHAAEADPSDISAAATSLTRREPDQQPSAAHPRQPLTRRVGPTHSTSYNQLPGIGRDGPGQLPHDVGPFEL